MNNHQETLKLIKEFFLGIMGAFRETSTEKLEFELREMENIFGLLVMGSLIGIPSPPTSISLRLLPYMLREMAVMTRRAKDMDDIFGEVAGLFDI